MKNTNCFLLCVLVLGFGLSTGAYLMSALASKEIVVLQKELEGNREEMIRFLDSAEDIGILRERERVHQGIDIREFEEMTAKLRQKARERAERALKK